MPLQNFIWIIMHNKRIEYFFYKFFRDSFFMFFYTIYLFSYLFFTWFTWFIFISFIYFLSWFIIILSCDLFIITIHFSWFFHLIHLFPHDSLFSHLIPSRFIIFSSDSFPWFIYFHVWFFHTIRYSHDILSPDLFTFVCDSCGNSVFKTLDTCLEGYYFHIFSRDSFIPLICQMILSHDSFLYVTHIHWFISFRVWFFQGMSLLLRCDSSTVDFF